MYFNQIRAYFGQSIADQILNEFLPNSNLYVDKLMLNEWHIYGSSRIGIYQTSINMAYRNIRIVNSVTTQETSTTVTLPSYTLFAVERGSKRYELTNHLGNVLAVVSDKKIQVCTSTTISYYIADLVSATDYSPFGAPLAGRSYTAPNISYRFAFNGKEKDDEVKGEGNSLDFGSRIYDSRLGKMFKPDPFGFAYPGTTPYSGMGGNPITNTDVDGKLIIFVNGFGPTRHGMPQTKLYKNWDVQMSMNIAATLKDDKAIYFNGSSRGVTGALSLLTIKKFGEDPLFTTAVKRFDLGAQAVKGEMAEIIKESLMAQRQSNPNAKINLVGHSMGVAYSAGVIQGLLDATDENGKHLFSESDFGEIWLLAGYQSGDIDKLPNVGEVYVRAHDNDGIAGNKPIPGFEGNFLSTYWKTESKLMEGSDAHGAETFGEYFKVKGYKMPTDVLKPTPKAKTPSSPSKPKSYPKKTPRML